MLFRDFNIIAAAGYAAQCAAERAPERLLWDELDKDAQNLFMQSVMAVARGESTAMGDVFEATAAAILGYNNGNGGLALEEIANIGGAVLSLGLLEEQQVAERNIRETVVELLEELAERRATGGVVGGPSPAFFTSPRFQALGLLSRHFPDDGAAGADEFTDFITKDDGEYDPESLNVLEMACQAISSSKQFESHAGNAISLALDYWGWLHPAEPVELTEPGNDEPTAVEPEPGFDRDRVNEDRVDVDQ